MENDFWTLYLADQMQVAVAEAKIIFPSCPDADGLVEFPFTPRQVVAFIRDARDRGYNGHPIRFIPAGLQLRDGLERQVALRKAHCLRSSDFNDRPTRIDQWVLWAPVPMRKKDGEVITDLPLGHEIKPLAVLSDRLDLHERMCVRPGTMTELVYLAALEHGRTGWPHGRDVTFVSEQLSTQERFGIRAMAESARLKLEIENWPMGMRVPYTFAPIVASLS